jgi:hypothetical protein
VNWWPCDGDHSAADTNSYALSHLASSGTLHHAVD